eukprot:TRINITY_DN704_c0_g3_i1.p1 TRINITY_DN704_c0_g3~~TRINITY_DN704_c0_g3_i1.p1  ORF type:complete len:107 (+),score=11.78 TRINITY_DN704_c0_g3_i1:169-489(+)
MSSFFVIFRNLVDVVACKFISCWLILLSQCQSQNKCWGDYIDQAAVGVTYCAVTKKKRANHCLTRFFFIKSKRAMRMLTISVRVTHATTNDASKRLAVSARMDLYL